MLKSCSFNFNPIKWAIEFSRLEFIYFDLEILGIGIYQNDSEMFLFGLTFSIRNLHMSITFLGFQLYIGSHSIGTYWPNGAILKHIWSRK